MPIPSTTKQLLIYDLSTKTTADSDTRLSSSLITPPSSSPSLTIASDISVTNTKSTTDIPSSGTSIPTNTTTNTTHTTHTTNNTTNNTTITIITTDNNNITPKSRSSSSTTITTKTNTEHSKPKSDNVTIATTTATTTASTTIKATSSVDVDIVMVTTHNKVDTSSIEADRRSASEHLPTTTTTTITKRTSTQPPTTAGPVAQISTEKPTREPVSPPVVTINDQLQFYSMPLDSDTVVDEIIDGGSFSNLTAENDPDADVIMYLDDLDRKLSVAILICALIFGVLMVVVTVYLYSRFRCSRFRLKRKVRLPDEYTHLASDTDEDP